MFRKRRFVPRLESVESRQLLSAAAGPFTLHGNPVSSGQVNLSWTPSANATCYTVAKSVNGAPFVTVGTTNQTTFAVGGLAPNTSYLLDVIASNDSSYAWSSNFVIETTWPPAPGPLTITGAGDSSGTLATLTWTPASFASSYVVLQMNAAHTAWNTIATTTSTSYVVGGLTPGTTNGFDVIAENVSGYHWADVFTWVNQPIPAPSAFSLQATSPAQGQINLSWTPSTNATSYEIYGKQDTAASWSLLKNEISTVTGDSFVGFPVNSRYLFYVQAINLGGQYVSNTVTVDIGTPAPGAFGISVALRSSQCIGVGWGQSEYASSYYVASSFGVSAGPFFPSDKLYFQFNVGYQKGPYTIWATAYNATGSTMSNILSFG